MGLEDFLGDMPPEMIDRMKSHYREEMLQQKDYTNAVREMLRNMPREHMQVLEGLMISMRDAGDMASHLAASWAGALGATIYERWAKFEIEAKEEEMAQRQLRNHAYDACDLGNTMCLQCHWCQLPMDSDIHKEPYYVEPEMNDPIQEVIQEDNAKSLEQILADEEAATRAVFRRGQELENDRVQRAIDEKVQAEQRKLMDAREAELREGLGLDKEDNIRVVRVNTMGDFFNLMGQAVGLSPEEIAEAKRDFDALTQDNEEFDSAMVIGAPDTEEAPISVFLADMTVAAETTEPATEEAVNTLHPSLLGDPDFSLVQCVCGEGIVLQRGTRDHWIDRHGYTRHISANGYVFHTPDR